VLKKKRWCLKSGAPKGELTEWRKGVLETRQIGEGAIAIEMGVGTDSLMEGGGILLAKI